LKRPDSEKEIEDFEFGFRCARLGFRCEKFGFCSGGFGFPSSRWRWSFSQHFGGIAGQRKPSPVNVNGES
jgi:hypothetical protein